MDARCQTLSTQGVIRSHQSSRKGPHPAHVRVSFQAIILFSAEIMNREIASPAVILGGLYVYQWFSTFVCTGCTGRWKFKKELYIGMHKCMSNDQFPPLVAVLHAAILLVSFPVRRLFLVCNVVLPSPSRFIKDKKQWSFWTFLGRVIFFALPTHVVGESVSRNHSRFCRVPTP